MTAPPASVIVASRNRPGALLRCLASLSQQIHPRFEVIVVADAAGRRAVQAAGLADGLKMAACDEANVSAARNIGLDLAAGEYVAFIDDDAVAEPTWLKRLCDAMQDLGADAAGGTVRARDGVRLATGAAWIDTAGITHPFDIPGDAPFCPDPPAGRAVKTEGTNCAFRRAALIAVGGFDPAFRYYLDEADLDLRLAAAGRRIAVVPLAQVHHRPAASDMRRGDGTPSNLFEIGASVAVFLRRYLEAPGHATALEQAAAEQRHRLLRRMVRGSCEPGDVPRLMATFRAGVDAGRRRDLAPPPKPVVSPPAFKAFQPQSAWRDHVWISGRWGRRARLHQEARRRISDGHRVSVILVSPWPRRHCVAFGNDGIWQHRLGRFARGPDGHRLPASMSLETLANLEIRRVSPFRDPSKKPSRP